MNRGAVLAYYLGIVRKHWLLILIIAAVVLGAGYFYHSRQVPVFEAKTKLKIIKKATYRTNNDAPLSFEEDQVFYNTQYNLLRTQLDWAEKVLDRAAWLMIDAFGVPWQADPEGAGEAVAQELPAALTAGLFDRLDSHEHVALEPIESKADPAAVAAVAAVRERAFAGVYQLDADTFLSGVKVEPVPGTYLAELSFQAKDRGVAVFFANLYAELYRDVSKGERREILEKEVARLTKAKIDLEGDGKQPENKGKLGEAKSALDTHKRENSSLLVGDRKNVYQEEADVVASRINSLETEQIARRAEESGLRDILAELGITLVERDRETGGEVVKEVEGLQVGGDVEEYKFLAEALPILGHPVLARDETVALYRGRVRAVEQEFYELPGDLTEKHPLWQRINVKRDQSKRELGVQVEACIVRYVEEGRRIAHTIRELSNRLDTKREEASKLNQDILTLERLQEEYDGLVEEKASLDRRLELLNEMATQDKDDAGSSDIQNIHIVRRARLRDARQTQPNTSLIMAMTVLSALFLSFGAAFLIEFLDDTIKTKADFERFVDVPHLGYVPSINVKEYRNKDTAVLEKPRSGVAEAFRSIRTAILFSKKDQELKSLILTSAGPGEGKTTVAVNLALTMAQAARGRVLLIDADLRKARVHKALDIDNKAGLTNLLVGSVTMAEVIQDGHVPGLDVITAGPPPPNPAELLGGNRMLEILAEARERYAKVIIDTPPLVAVTDSCLLAPLVDGVFLVISVGKTSWRLIQRGKESLQAVGVEPTGAVLNNIRIGHQGYGYGYGYGYGSGGYHPDDGGKAVKQ